MKNWHEFERKGMSAGAKVQRNGVAETIRATIKIGEKTTSGRGGRYMTEQALQLALSDPKQSFRVIDDRRPKKPELVVEETRYVESDAKLMQRLLGREVGSKQNLLVLNDEAHHAYGIRQEAADTAEEDSEQLDEDRMLPCTESGELGTAGCHGSRTAMRWLPPGPVGAVTRA